MRKHQKCGLIAPLRGALALVIWAGSVFAASAPAVVGDWEGALDTGNGSLRVIIHIAQAQGASLTGTLDSPDQGAAGIAISSVSYKEPTLQLEIEQLRSGYEGKLNKDNSEITGQWKQGSASLPLTLKRVAK